MSNILSEIIQLMVGGITGIATGVGAGLSTLAQSVFLQTTEGVTSLSTFGALVVIFAGISLAKPLASINCYKNLESFNANQNGSYCLKVYNTCNA